MLLLLAFPAFSQSGNASLNGSVEDAQGAYVPGVTITATNNNTGVASETFTNDVGVYNFPSLLPGLYNVKAALDGFQTKTFTDVQLRSSSQVRLNFELQVAGLEEIVEISVDADQLLLESSSSVGDVLTENEVAELPRVNNNVLDLVKIMAGANISDDAIFGEASGTGGGQTTFAGVASNNININVNGVPVSDVRQPAGVNSPTRLNPDLVGEFSMILAPVDAEYGRGNGQIQVTTRSGANEYHGSAAWNIQNTALDPNTWQNNHTAGTTKPWRNLNEYTLTFSGPIIKNKTFFFVLWNQQFARTRSDTEAIVLTPCARKGIYRWFDNWNNAPYLSTTNLNPFAPSTAVVDVVGNPVTPSINPDGSPFTGQLRYQSVFGPLTDAAKAQIAADPVNCSEYDFDVPGTVDGTWDPYRTDVDPTGFMSKFLDVMPLPNEYEVGDGLNSGGIRWTRTLSGADNLYGIGEDTNRKQINVRIDHNFNDKHRISGNMSFERNKADDTFATWPQNSWPGAVRRQPAIYSINFASSFTPTMLNEVNFGVSRTGTNVYTPLSNPDTRDAVRDFMPMVDDVTVIVGPGGGSWFLSPFYFQPDGAFGGRGYPSSPYGSRGFVIGDLWDSSPRWTIGDTLSWARGAHSFKWGGEFRRSNSYGASGWSFEWATFNSFVSNPYAAGGESPYSTITGIHPDYTGTSSDPDFPGLVGGFFGNADYMGDLLNFHSGSLANLRQQNYINSANQVEAGEWVDQTVDPLPVRDFGQNEVALFFKDDWKVSSNLTLNLGLRWEYYGVPYLRNGLTTSFEDGGGAIFGISGRSWQEAFWQPAEERAGETQVIFVGPGSPNPGTLIYNRDLNNFGPAVGFAWTPSFLGQGSTTIRGGYQVSYISIGRVSEVASYIGASTPGSVYNATYRGDPETNPYLDLTDIVSRVPVPDGIVPLAPIPLTDRLQDIGTFDPNIRSPYIQNVTLSITHNLGSKITLDARYIGTLSRKMYQNVNVNAVNFLKNGLFEAFNAARMGDDDNPATAILDQYFSVAPDYDTYGSGAAYLRESNVNAGGSGISDSLANGDYVAIATQMNLLGYPNGQYLRDAELGENFIKANPQFSSATMRTNGGGSNYHSFQFQFSLRPVHGLSMQATYTLSKNLGRFGSPTNPLHPEWDYTRSSSDRTHVLSTYGAFDLPMGPGKAFLSDTNGVLSRIVEGWNLSWIANVSSGRPANISAEDMLYANGVPDLVGDFDINDAGIYWEDGALRGNYFSYKYMMVSDPQCEAIDSSLASRCNLGAVALVDGYDDSGNPIAGDVVLQNPQPGYVGTFGRNKFNGPIVWSFDLAMAKSITLTEGKRISFRMDASNILNHPQPSYGVGVSGTRLTYANLPEMSLSSSNTYFGDVNNKAQNRTFQFMLRFDF